MTKASKITTNKRKPTSNKRTLSANGRQTPETANDEPPKINKHEVARILIGVLLLVFGAFMVVACVSYLFTGNLDQGIVESHQWSGESNWGGSLGAHLSHRVMSWFGLATFFLHAFLIASSLRLLKVRVRLWKWFLNCGILLIWCSAAFDCWLKPTFNLLGIFTTLQAGAGGNHGAWLVQMMRDYIGSIGVFFLLIVTAICYMAYVSIETVHAMRRGLVSGVKFAVKHIHKKHNEPNEESELDTNNQNVSESVNVNEDEDENESLGVKEDEEITESLTFDNEQNADDEDVDEDVDVEHHEADEAEFIIEKTHVEETAGEDIVGDEIGVEPFDPKKDLERYKYPTLKLLDTHGSSSVAVDADEQINNKNRIIKVLKDFGVEISTIKATVGPTITLYEIQPAPGVRISKVRNLEDDIALSLAALGIRIIAPMPGKGTVGIEVPNAKPQIVSMESILNSKRFLETDYELPCAIGKTITNEVYMIDLVKMPHLLVAGATGQGKSVGLNAIITSLLYKKHPSELKLVMVDPKKVEFSVYQPLVRHFLAQVEDEPEDEAIITDVTKVVATLQSLCAEMDERYNLLKKARVRDIREYNNKFKARRLNPEAGHRYLPYIVVIIDEFGDLIMTAGKEVELPIARIAQLARAVGIHMIIATQRPTTNIITGTIKANFPARMAFKVSAMIDSRTILDRPGANQLVGRGDMLFLSGGEPVRVQCAFVDTPEVERITAHIASQQGYTTSFPLKRVMVENDCNTSREVDTKALDPLFDEIAHWVVTKQNGSTSSIQRTFELGYNRAGRITDQLEAAGIVGPARGSKPREVLVQDELSLERILTSLH